MKEVLCIDGNFEAGALEFYKKFGVVYPEEGKMYTIRQILRHSNGEIGVRLEELVNPDVPITNPILGVIYMEPSFAAKRFVHLDSTPLSLTANVEEEVTKTFLPIN